MRIEGVDVKPCDYTSIAFPGSFHGMIHGICNATDYVGAVREEIKAGGDNCSRVTFIGAYCGAK